MSYVSFKSRFNIWKWMWPQTLQNISHCIRPMLIIRSSNDFFVILENIFFSDLDCVVLLSRYIDFSWFPVLSSRTSTCWTVTIPLWSDGCWKNISTKNDVIETPGLLDILQRVFFRICFVKHPLCDWQTWQFVYGIPLFQSIGSLQESQEMLLVCTGQFFIARGLCSCLLLWTQFVALIISMPLVVSCIHLTFPSGLPCRHPVFFLHIKVSMLPFLCAKGML